MHCPLIESSLAASALRMDTDGTGGGTCQLQVSSLLLLLLLLISKDFGTSARWQQQLAIIGGRSGGK